MKKGGVNIEDTRVMKLREDYEVKRARRAREVEGGLKGANIVQDIVREWNIISACASDWNGCKNMEELSQLNQIGRLVYILLYTQQNTVEGS